MPTEKSKEIERMLTNLTGISRQTAAKLKVCTWCKGDVGPFRDARSEREYQISGFCQDCQDKTFDVEEESDESFIEPSQEMLDHMEESDPRDTVEPHSVFDIDDQGVGL